MTISNTNRTAGPFIGNGITTAFPFTFKIFKTADLLAVQTDVATGIATPLVLNSGYTVTLNPDQNASPGGTVTLPAALATGKTLVLTSDLAYLQPLDLTNGGGFYPSVINAALDRITIFCQQLFSLASRSLKLPLSDTGMSTELPSAAARANKLLGFDSEGRPIVTAPVSGSAAEVAISLANALAFYLSSSGSSIIGWIQYGAGAFRRTIESKLRDTVDWTDFKQPGDTDDTPSLIRAIASGAERVRFRGVKNVGGNVTIMNPLIISGDGRLSQINFTSNDAWFKILGTRVAIAQAIEFESLTLSGFGFNTVPHIFMDWARQIKFTHAFLYHCGLSCNHMNFWNITDTEVYNSTTTVRYTQDDGEDNQVSGAPRVTAGFFSESPIVLEDSVDLQITNSHFFQRGITSRLVNWTNKGGPGIDPAERPKSTFLISNSFFDSIFGLALDFWDVGLTSVTGNFFSAGRNEAQNAVYFYRSWHTKFVGNTFVYCGKYGLSIESGENVKVIANNFIGNKDGGLQTVGSCNNITILGNGFANTPSVLGGSYVQPIGYIDTNQDGKGIILVFNNFKTPADMAQQIYLLVNSTNRNSIMGNDGVLDVLAYGKIGTTAERPTGVQAGYGYYDGSLSLPIWWSGAAWRNAAGTIV